MRELVQRITLALVIGGACWFVSGGTGFFARHFTRYLLEHAHPRQVRLYARSESSIARCVQECPDPRLRWLVGDVRDPERLLTALRGVDYAVHAAALKRVEVCEREPWEALATNVTGTQNMAAACILAGVQRAVFLSTDKAAAPHTFYGVTKLAAERLWVQSNAYAAGTPTRFAATRYGNVVGSTGSVVEVWRAQHASATPLTMTDPGATRFLMSPAHACRLVVQAFEQMQGGEVFLPKLKAAGLEQLAKAVIGDHLLAYRVTGLRPGEKRHEELLTEHERPRAMDGGDLYVLPPQVAHWTDTPPRVLGAGIDRPYRSDLGERYTDPELAELVG